MNNKKNTGIKAIRIKKIINFLVLSFLFSWLIITCQNNTISVFEKEIPLVNDWILISSAYFTGYPNMAFDNWQLSNAIRTKVPTTVLAALVQNGVYPDPYFGKNLEKIPTSQFDTSWWYIKKFNLTTQKNNKQALLKFEGINYRANIWLNGKQIASSDTLEGAFRVFTINVTSIISDNENILAVEVFPPKPGEFTIGFVDWNPTPPDKNMGLFRPVTLCLSGPVAIQSPFVKTKINLGSLNQAELTIEAELINFSSEAVEASLWAIIEKNNIHKIINLAPGEKKLISLKASEFKDLIFMNPRLWWPNGYGNPEMYKLQLNVEVNGEISDTKSISFGIRDVEDYYNAKGHRGYRINGKEILIKGGGWVDDLLLADSRERIEAQIKYAKHLNLNTLRLEGFWGTDQTLYNLCDSLGIMLMVGWSCHWEWDDFVGKVCDEFGGISTEQEIALISQSWHDQIEMLRNHPSIFVWLGGSDLLPRPELERRCLEILKKSDGERAYLGAAGNLESEVSGRTGVKMNGPYAFTPPVYWYVDKKYGGAYGFNTETGPGAQIPTLRSIKKMIPVDSIWPINSIWEFHSALSYKFNNLNRLFKALENRYGPSSNVDDFTFKAQIMNYELMRPMFESFRSNKGEATGIIQWMYNSAWPKMYWQLFDYYLMPNGAFYGAKKALEPIHLIYNYHNQSISAVNDTRISHFDMVAEIKIFGLDSQLKFGKDVKFSIRENSVVGILDSGFLTPILEKIQSNQFLHLRLIDSKKSLISSNFYWLSTKQDIPDFPKTEGYYTPTKQYAEFTQILSLPSVPIEAYYKIIEKNDFQQIMVTLHNSSNSISLFNELVLIDEVSGEAIVPVFWDDNYISLIPREKREIMVSFDPVKQFSLLLSGASGSFKIPEK